MHDNEKFAIAARLHVLLRRLLGRVTDVEWMVRNAEYAREIIKVARAAPHADLQEWAGRLEATLAPSTPVVMRHPLPPHAAMAAAPQRYVGSVR